MAMSEQLPNDVTSEEMVLGAIMQQPGMLSSLRNRLRPDHFYVDAYGKIYQTLLDMSDAGKPIDDLHLLQSELKRRPAYHENGDATDLYTWLQGGSRFTIWIDQCIMPANAPQYAETIIEKATCRELMYRAEEVRQHASSGNLTELAKGNGHYNLSALIEEARQSEEEQRPFTFLRADEFLRVIGPPPPMLVDGLIPQNSLVLMSGKPKAGKSLAALDLLNSIARGLPVFGQYRVNTPGPVCYLGMEDGGREICRRISYRGIARPGDVPEFYACADQVILSSDESMELLWEKIAPLHPVALCIDTAAEALGVRDWNNRGEVVEKMRPLRKFTRKHVSVLLVVHNRKSLGVSDDAGDEIAGTNAVAGAADGFISMMKVEKFANKNRRITWNVEGRGGMNSLQFVTEMDTRDCSFRALDENTLANARARETLAANEKWQAVCAAIKHHAGKATTTQIMAHSDLAYKAANTYIREMVNCKVLQDTQEQQAAGSKGGRPSTFYCIAPEYLSFSASLYPEEETHKHIRAHEEDEDVYDPAADPFADEDD